MVVAYAQGACFSLSVLILLALSGCGKQPRSSDHARNARCARKMKSTATTNVVSTRPVIPVHEAKLTDIPIPLGAQPTCFFEQEDGAASFFAFHSRMSAEDLEQFYLQQMEQMGWQQSRILRGPETLILFERPERFCSVSVRPFDGALCEVVLFLSNDVHSD